MNFHLHELDGCRPTPLAHYLKALGALRLVAQQVDPEVRGAWRNGRFVLRTAMSRDELCTFFLNTYRPSPMLSPWNGGSGFYPKDNVDAISRIAAATSERFASYRAAIQVATSAAAGKDKRPDAGPAKNALLAHCQREWDAEACAWFASAVMLDDAGEAAYPALLGTGGNDGRLDFTNNYMQWLVALLDPDTGSAMPQSASLLNHALFGGVANDLATGSIGQFNPGAAGGANSGNGFDGSPKWNPWDFVLMLEGALVLRVAGLRKLDGGQRVQASAPFALRASTRGYGTGADADASARGEQWFPLWPNLASFREVEQLFGEARLRSGRHVAEGALDAARALGSLGVARGLDSFVRYSYLERNGLSNLAVPTGVFPVRYRPEVRLLDEVDRYLDSIRRAGGDRSAAFARLSRDLDSLALACAESHAGTQRWQDLVVALGASEHAMLSRPKLVAEAFLRGLPALSSRWIRVIDDGSAELRIALAIATAHDPEGKLGPIRAHAIPLDAKKHYRELAKDSDGLARDTRVVWEGRSLILDLSAVALQRAQEATRSLFPLTSPLPASLADVALFVEGALDETRIHGLARGLMTLQTNDLESRPVESSAGALAAHALVRLAYPSAQTGIVDQQASPVALQQLRAGRLDTAITTLSRAMVARGVRVKFSRLSGSREFAQRLAASIAIPISPLGHRELLRLVAKPSDTHSESEAR